MPSRARAASVMVCASSASASTTVSSRRRTAAVSAEYSGVPESRNGFGRTGSGGTGESYPAPRNAPGTVQTMEFRRINALPPYVLGVMDALKIEARRAGEDVIDLGFGNPDIPSPDVAVKKLAEAVENPRNHRYSSSRGIPKLRLAIADLYRRRFGVELDPDTQVCSTIGAKEGFSHLMWVLLGPGDAALGAEPVVPDPHLGPALRRRRGSPRAARTRTGLLRQPAGGLGRLVATAARHRALLPAQPDHRVRRPRLHDPHGRFRTRARRPARARLRVRRSRVRRLHASVDPRGSRRDRRRGRALHAHEVVLDGGMADGLPARQCRSRRRARRS